MIQNKNIQDSKNSKLNYQQNQNHNFKYLKQSPIFLSKSSRIQLANNSISPGPAAYEIPNKDIQRTSLYRKQLRQKNQSSLYSKQYLWIIEDRFKTIAQKSKHLGPGLYNPEQQKSFSNNSDWGKSQRFRNKIKNTDQYVGPGAYDIVPAHRSSGGAQSAFKSNSPKFSQSKLNKQSSQCLNLQTKLVKSKQYQKSVSNLQTFQILQKHRQNIENRTHKKKKLKSYVFASILPRFKQDRMSKLGPGCYNPQINLQLKRREELQKNLTKSKINFSANDNNILNENLIKNASYIQLNQNPGPNHYNVDQYYMEKKVKNSEKLHFAKQTRFDFRKRKTKSVQQIPGPGYYNQNRFIYIKKDQYFNPLRKLNQNKIAFLSGQGQNPQQLIKYTQKQPFGYNTNVSDIQTQMLKKKEHLQKLKLMDVQVAPFNTKQKRF